jgi:hypothetical protein
MHSPRGLQLAAKDAGDLLTLVQDDIAEGLLTPARHFIPDGIRGNPQVAQLAIITAS